MSGKEVPLGTLLCGRCRKVEASRSSPWLRGRLGSDSNRVSPHYNMQCDIRQVDF